MTLFREWEAQKYFRVGLLNTAAALLIIYVLAKYREAATSKSFIFNSKKGRGGSGGEGGCRCNMSTDGFPVVLLPFLFMMVPRVYGGEVCLEIPHIHLYALFLIGFYFLLTKLFRLIFICPELARLDFPSFQM